MSRLRLTVDISRRRCDYIFVKTGWQFDARFSRCFVNEGVLDEVLFQKTSARFFVKLFEIIPKLFVPFFIGGELGILVFPV